MRFSGTLSSQMGPPRATNGTFSYDLERHVCSVTYDNPHLFAPSGWEHHVRAENERIRSRVEFDELRTSGGLAKRLWNWGALGGSYCAIEAWAEPKLGVGEHWPRIWQKGGPKPHEVGVQDVLTDAMVAYRGLESSILDVFNVVHPTKENMKAHGHRMRELLILCCTEVELLLVDAAKANGLKSGSRHYTMQDYVKLSEPLTLGEWGVKLQDYADYGEISPFEGWSQSNPNLAWYQAYNAVKHGRRTNFKQASLENLLLAAGAIFVLLAAEFGEGMEMMKFENPHRLFSVTQVPVRAPDDGYIKPTTGNWIPVPLFGPPV